MLAADFVTPEAINFMARYGRGLICLTLTEERCRSSISADGASNNALAARHQFHGVDRGGRRRHDRHFRRRPRAHGAGRRRARTRSPSDIVQPGHIFPLHGAARRRARARRAHRSRLRPRRARRPHAGRGDLRDHEGRRRRWRACPTSIEFARAARPEDRHDRRPDPLPQPHRDAGRAHRRAHDQTAHGAFRLVVYRDKLERCDAPRARARHDRARHAKRWCACTSRCR